MLITIYSEIIKILLFLPIAAICDFYDYGIFENFEITKASFIKEQRIVRELEQMRDNLYQRKDYLDLYKEHLSTTNAVTEKLVDFQVKDLFENRPFENKPDSYRDIYDEFTRNHSLPDIFNFKYNVRMEKIFEEASKGLMMIHDTYDLDTKQFSRGHLNLKNGVEMKSRKIDSLQPDDLASISTTAFRLHWYDTSLKYLREAIDLFNQISEEERRILLLPSAFEDTLLQMKRGYSKYHNSLLIKKQQNIGPEWKLFPNLVNEGMNRKLSAYILFHFSKL